MKLSIIILSFNTKDLVEACIESVNKNLKLEHEIIVVDNASYDGTASMLKYHHKNVRVIENDKNYGFAKGINIGAEKAKGDILLFLNSDTQLPKDHGISEAIQKIESRGADIVGGLLLNQNHTAQRSFGSFYSPIKVFLMLLGGDKAEMSLQKGEKERLADWVSGGFMFVKKDVFKKLHGFDENFFMYIEDMELCYRAKKAGYVVLFDPEVKVMHLGQGSSNRAFAIKNIYKNLLYFYKKHKSKPAYYVVKTMLMAKAYILIVFATLFLRKNIAATYKEAVRF